MAPLGLAFPYPCGLLFKAFIPCYPPVTERYVVWYYCARESVDTLTQNPNALVHRAFLARLRTPYHLV